MTTYDDLENDDLENDDLRLSCLQDRANFWQTGLYWHKKHYSIIVFCRFVLHSPEITYVKNSVFLCRPFLLKKTQKIPFVSLSFISRIIMLICYCWMGQLWICFVVTPVRCKVGRFFSVDFYLHIVADTNVSLFARPRNICCGHKFCVRHTKNVSDFVQKHFVSATNVSQFAQPKKHHGQQCVRNNVSSFARALKMPLAKLSFFCIHYFWRTKPKATEIITEWCFSCQNKSVCQKLARSCKKWKSPKIRYTPFLHEGLQLFWMQFT